MVLLGLVVERYQQLGMKWHNLEHKLQQSIVGLNDGPGATVYNTTEEYDRSTWTASGNLATATRSHGKVELKQLDF